MRPAKVEMIRRTDAVSGPRVRGIGTLAAIAGMALAACASPRAPVDAARSWERGCFVGVEADTAALAGPDAVDCGILHSGADADVRRQGIRCARAAVAGTRPFRFGYSGPGTDSMVCRIAVRGTDGRLWGFLFDSDVTGQGGLAGNHSALRVSRCRDVRFLFDPEPRGGFFELLSCNDDRGQVERIIAARRQRSE